MYRWNNVGKLPLKEEDYAQFADSKCKKCYGRGFTGNRIMCGKEGLKNNNNPNMSIILCKCVDLEGLYKFVKIKNEEKKIKEKTNMVDSIKENKKGDKVT